MNFQQDPFLLFSGFPPSRECTHSHTLPNKGLVLSRFKNKQDQWVTIGASTFTQFLVLRIVCLFHVSKRREQQLKVFFFLSVILQLLSFVTYDKLCICQSQLVFDNSQCSFLGAILSNKTWEEIQLFILLLKLDICFALNVSYQKPKASESVWATVSLFLPMKLCHEDKEQHREEAVAQSDLGNSSCPPALLITNRDDSLLGSTQMLTWPIKSFAKFNFSGPSLPLLGKIKQLINLDAYIVLFGTGIKEQAFTSFFNVLFLISLKPAYSWNICVYRRHIVQQKPPQPRLLLCRYVVVCCLKDMGISDKHTY